LSLSVILTAGICKPSVARFHARRARRAPFKAASSSRKGELGEGTTRRDASDLVPMVLSEPDVAIRARRDGRKGTPGSRDGERGDRTRPRRRPTSAFVYQGQHNATGPNDHETGQSDEEPLVCRPDHARRGRPA